MRWKLVLVCFGIVMIIHIIQWMLMYQRDRITATDNVSISHDEIVLPKSITFMGSTGIHSFRLGGGEFLDVTKQFLAEKISKHRDTLLIRNDNIVKYGKSGRLFSITWCVCNYFLGWILEWNMDIILFDKMDEVQINKKNKKMDKVLNTIAEYDVIMIYAANKISLNWTIVDQYREQYLNKQNKQYRYYIEVEAFYAGMFYVF